MCTRWPSDASAGNSTPLKNKMFWLKIRQIHFCPPQLLLFCQIIIFLCKQVDHVLRGNGISCDSFRETTEGAERTSIWPWDTHHCPREIKSSSIFAFNTDMLYQPVDCRSTIIWRGVLNKTSEMETATWRFNLNCSFVIPGFAIHRRKSIVRIDSPRCHVSRNTANRHKI